MISIPTNIAKHYTNGLYTTPPHIQLIEKKLLHAAAGKIKRLIITMPPRHGKSELISKYFPAWLMLHNNNTKVLLTSYETSFACKWSFEAREVYKSFKNDLIISRNDYWLNSNKSSLNAVGAGGSITGKGANFLIIDDPYKNHETALSTTQREKIWDWFNSVAYTRLEPNGVIILIQTRWHKDDLAGRLLQNTKEDWQLLNLPAIATENDPLNREVGEPLWAQRFDLNTLNTIKSQIGSYWFASLYQQTPITSENQLFKNDWFKFYDYVDNFDLIVQSWDTAFKDKQLNDYSVCVTFGLKDNKYYLIDLFKDKLKYPNLREAVIKLYNKHNPSVVLIEDAASGQSLIQDIKQFTRLPIKPQKAKTDKTVKAHEISPLFEAGSVFIKTHHKDFIQELTEFPFSPHDDILDATYYALTYLKQFNKLAAFPKIQFKQENYFKI